MFDYEWVQTKSPAGAVQWAPTLNGNAGPDIIMLTTDLALGADPIYEPISREYAADIDALGQDFAAAWYRLTTADMGPHSRCIGDLVPDPQPFQYSLPESPETLPNYIESRSAIQQILDEDSTASKKFINLAYRSASTFRATDYRGGGKSLRDVNNSTAV